MPLKEHITIISADLFSRRGIKRVSMDDVARKANVSKRTLYEFFKDKESLLIEVLIKVHEPFINNLDVINRGEGTALEALLLFNEKLMEKPLWVCDDFFADIIRYPVAIQMITEGKRRFLIKIVEILKRGEKEGIFMSDVNYDIISLMTHQQFSKSEPSPMYTKYTHEEVHNTFFLIFIRGICTDTGREILEKYLLKKKYKEKFAYGDL